MLFLHSVAGLILLSVVAAAGSLVPLLVFQVDQMIH